MARTALTPISAPGPYDTAGAALAFTAGDVANGNSFKATGREILLVQNSGASAYAVTVQSRALPGSGRTGNAAYTISAGEFRVFQMFPVDGWMQTDGYVYVDAANAALKLAVVKLP